MTPRYPENFYGFPEIPFHVHLGMRFDRPDPDGPAVLTIPPLPEAVSAEREQSPAAVYTLAEVACGVGASDALLLHHTMGNDDTTTLVLTKQATFWPRGRAIGTISSQTEVVGNEVAARERLGRTRRVKVETHARIHGEDGVLAGEMRAVFYARIMARERLQAMAGPLLPTMAQPAAR